MSETAPTANRASASKSTGPEITQNMTDQIYKESCRRIELTDEELAALHLPLDDLR